MYFRASPALMQVGDVLKNEEGDWTVEQCERGFGAYARDFKIELKHPILGTIAHWYPESIELEIHRSI